MANEEEAPIVGDLFPAIVTPETVRADIRKVKAYAESLNAEVGKWFKKTPPQDDAETQFLADFTHSYLSFQEWADQYLVETWSLTQTLATTAIAAQNDAWRREFQTYQDDWNKLRPTTKSTVRQPEAPPGAIDAPSSTPAAAGNIIMMFIIGAIIYDLTRKGR